MTDKKFHFIVALYCFCRDYHSGQWSRGHRLLSRIERRYSPRNMPGADDLNDGWDEWQETGEIYNRLVSNYANKI